MKKDQSIIIEEVLPREKSRPHCPADDKKRKDCKYFFFKNSRIYWHFLISCSSKIVKFEIPMLFYGEREVQMIRLKILFYAGDGF